MSNTGIIEEETDSEELSQSLLDIIAEERKEKGARLVKISFGILVLILVILLFQPTFIIVPHLILAVATIYWSFFLQVYREKSELRIIFLILALIVTAFSFSIFSTFLFESLPLYYWLSFVIPILTVAIIVTGMSDFREGRITFWVFVSLDILTAGIVLVLLGTGIVFSDMVIEMAGAFVGLGSAIALGELLKALQIRGESKRLYHTLLEELDDILKELRKNREVDLTNRDDIPYTMWYAALNTREMLDIDFDIRKKLTQAYYMISKYNESNTDTNIDIAIEAIESFITREEEDTESDKENTESEVMNETTHK